MMDEIKIAQGLKREDGSDFRNWIIKGKQLIQKKKYRKALLFLLELVEEKEVNHADIFYLLGETYRILQDFDKAVKYLLKSLRFDEFPVQVGKSLGLCYFSIGKYGKCALALKGYLQKSVKKMKFPL